jgi:spore coat protein CotH
VTHSFFIFLLFLIIGCTSVFSQDDFYDTRSIREIRITFREHNWKQILDSLFVNEGDEGRLVADVTIEGKPFRNAGVRYKGYSSWNSDELKNPFNIELDYSVKNQNYKGYSKIKLSNVINDPSFVREVLSYEIAAKYMPVPSANYANLYINDTLIGLYTNVESVDKLFTEKQFLSDKNPFFKGEPDHLQYPFGQNANLAYTHGSDSSGYFPYYTMESDWGWNDLLHLIYTLDRDSMNLGSVLNTDRALWMHAFNYALLNLDSYIGYSQNYYLYEDDSGRFNPVIWDLNMSFGSFRESDGSIHYNGLTIGEMKVLDPLEHLYFSISPRPLMTNLFKNTTFRKMYLAHIRTILDENFRNNWYFTEAKDLHDLIDPDVLNDPNRFYSYDDFQNNLTVTVGGTGSMIEYPGIRDLVESRLAYLDSFPGIHGEPVISSITHFPDHPLKGEETAITATITGSSGAFLAYRFSGTASFQKAILSDDGNHHDGIAGDGIYGATVIPDGYTIQYYIYAENDVAGAFSPERAEYGFYTIQQETVPGEIAINEIAVLNNGTKDQDRQADPWIELINTTPGDIWISGFSLSDDPEEPSKWKFPDTVLQSRNYLIAWADNDPWQPGIHTNFRLTGNGGTVILSNDHGSVLDRVSYGEQVPGKSIGRYPNGWGPFVFMEPSCSLHNYTGTTPSDDFLLYPVPATDKIRIESKSLEYPVSYTIFDIRGCSMVKEEFSMGPEVIPAITRGIDVSGLARGTYFIRIITGSTVITRKFILD